MQHFTMFTSFFRMRAREVLKRTLPHVSGREVALFLDVGRVLHACVFQWCPSILCSACVNRSACMHAWLFNDLSSLPGPNFPPSLIVCRMDPSRYGLSATTDANKKLAGNIISLDVQAASAISLGRALLAGSAGTSSAALALGLDRALYTELAKRRAVWGRGRQGVGARIRAREADLQDDGGRPLTHARNWEGCARNNADPASGYRERKKRREWGLGRPGGASLPRGILGAWRPKFWLTGTQDHRVKKLIPSMYPLIPE